MPQLGAITAKAVGNQDVGTGRSILGVNPGHGFRRDPIHLFRAASRRQTTLLQEGPHGAIENQDSVR